VQETLSNLLCARAHQHRHFETLALSPHNLAHMSVDGSSRRSTAARSVAGASAPSQLDEDEQCHACCGFGNVSKLYQQCWFHHGCFLGVRSRQRVLALSSPDAKSNDVSLMQQNPTQWRPLVKRYCNPTGVKGAHRTAALRATKQTLVKGHVKQTVG
jgi:hypothetical protein